ncbi:hypothetical protein ON010_g4785 [Phytophthora cinnamomi]|nr:hypothetical protein ON010_g4785 [Phytophthora cinnamomi]
MTAATNFGVRLIFPNSTASNTRARGLPASSVVTSMRRFCGPAGVLTSRNNDQPEEEPSPANSQGISVPRQATEVDEATLAKSDNLLKQLRVVKLVSRFRLILAITNPPDIGTQREFVDVRPWFVDTGAQTLPTVALLVRQHGAPRQPEREVSTAAHELQCCQGAARGREAGVPGPVLHRVAGVAGHVRTHRAVLDRLRVPGAPGHDGAGGRVAGVRVDHRAAADGVVQHVGHRDALRPGLGGRQREAHRHLAADGPRARHSVHAAAHAVLLVRGVRPARVHGRPGGRAAWHPFRAHLDVAMGVMMPTTVVGTLSMGVSVAANYFFIYGAFGWTGLGFDGSALATVVASWFQPTALTWYCVVYKKLHLQAWGGWDFSEFTRERMTVFYKNSAPAAVNSLVSSVASSALSLIAAWLGADIIAANAIVSGFWRLLWALFWGFGSGTQIRVSNLLGANRPNAAKTLSILGFGSTVVTVTVLALVTLLFRADVFRLYTNDGDLLNVCVAVLPIFVVAFMVEATEMVFASILSAMGQVHITAWTSTLATWLVQLPAAYVLTIVLEGGFAALWYSICLMEVLKLIVYVVVLRRIDFAAMAREAVKNMEVEDEEEEVSVAVAEGGTTALGANTGLPSPVPTTLLTPSGLVHQWDHVDDGVHQHQHHPAVDTERSAAA